MADEQNQKQDVKPEEKKAEETTPQPVPYERFAEVNKKASELEKRLAAIEADKKKAEEAQLTEQNKWKELAEKREQELTAERTERLRLSVAVKTGLPADLAARLRGATEEELLEDAKQLAQFMKPAEGAGVPPANSNGRPVKLDIANMTPEQIRQNRAKLMAQNGR